MLACEACGPVADDEIEDMGGWLMHIDCGSEVRSEAAWDEAEAAGGRDG